MFTVVEEYEDELVSVAVAPLVGTEVVSISVVVVSVVTFPVDAPPLDVVKH